MRAYHVQVDAELHHISNVGLNFLDLTVAAELCASSILVLKLFVAAIIKADGSERLLRAREPRAEYPSVFGIVPGNYTAAY